MKAVVIRSTFQHFLFVRMVANQRKSGPSRLRVEISTARQLRPATPPAFFLPATGVNASFRGAYWPRSGNTTGFHTQQRDEVEFCD